MTLKTRSITAFLIALVLVGFLGTHLGTRPTSTELLTPSVHAATLQERISSVKAEDQKEPDKAPDVDEMVTKVAQLWTYVLKVFNPLISFFAFKIGALLNNDHIFAGNMGNMLQNIWRVNRNLVNILFVLILLYLALKHIFSGEEGGTDLKKVLPTFALMLIAVNFSWLAGKVVLDAANVATNIVFSIPTAVQGVAGAEQLQNKIENCDIDPQTNKTKGSCYPTTIYKVTDSTKTVNLKADECKNENIEQKVKDTYKDPETGQPAEDNKASDIYGIDIFCWQTINFADYNQNNASYFLTYSMARVQNLTRASNQGIAKVAIGGIFSLVIQLVYVVSFGALFIALIFRIAILWFFMAFSPLLVLIFFIKKANLSELGGGESGTLNLGTFAQWAFAPTKVAAVWSVGFIMVTMGQTEKESLFTKTNAAGEVTGKFYKIDTLFMGMDNLQQFIWLLMTLGIIWMGTFAVLKDLKIAGEIFNRINSWGTGLAKKVAQSPTWAPILPVYDSKTGRPMTLAGLAKMPHETLDALRTHYTGESEEKFIKAHRNLKKWRDDDATGKVDSLVTRAVDQKEDAAKDELYREFTSRTNISPSDLRDSSQQTQIKDALSEAGGIFKGKTEEIYKVLRERAERDVGGTKPPPPPTPQAASSETPPPPPSTDAQPAVAGAAPVASAPGNPPAGGTTRPPG